MDAQTEIHLRKVAEKISKSLLGGSELQQLCDFLGWLEVHSTTRYSGASSSSALGLQTFLPGKPAGTHSFQPLPGYGETTPSILPPVLQEEESSPGMVRERHKCLRSVLGTKDVSEQGGANSPSGRQPYSLPPTIMQNHQDVLLGRHLWRSVVLTPQSKGRSGCAGPCQVEFCIPPGTEIWSLRRTTLTWRNFIMASWNVPSCSMYLLAHVPSLSASSLLRSHWVASLPTET